jgi:hypothetical protein
MDEQLLLYHFECCVKVVQYPTEREARDWAGQRKHAFSWGRFLIYGANDALVEEIKRHL